MKKISTIEDVYPAIEELISVLPDRGKNKLAEKLDHRMHKVSWTSSSELLEELFEIINESMSDFSMDVELLGQMKTIVLVIKEVL